MTNHYCSKKQAAPLRKVVDFKFKKHDRYNVFNERLSLLNKMINERARELLNIIENVNQTEI